MAQAGRVSVTQFLDLLTAYKDEDDANVAGSIAKHLGDLKTLHASEVCAVCCSLTLILNSVTLCMPPTHALGKEVPAEQTSHKYSLLNGGEGAHMALPLANFFCLELFD